MKVYILIALAFSLILTGCECKQPIPEIKTEYVYLDKKIPELQEKPKPEYYDVIMVQFNGKDYYSMDKVNGKIMESNWVSYKNWCEGNFNILLELKKD